jgi:hypothetical protein
VIEHERLAQKLVRAGFAALVTAAVIVATYFTIGYLAARHVP